MRRPLLREEELEAEAEIEPLRVVEELEAFAEEEVFEVVILGGISAPPSFILSFSVILKRRTLTRNDRNVEESKVKG